MSGRPLRYEENEEWRSLLSEDPLHALGRLHASLDRGFLQLGEPLRLQAPAAALLVIPRWVDRELLAVACTDGSLRLIELGEQGLVPLPGQLQLAGWDARRDELLCLFLSHRPLSRQPELFLVVRRWETGGAPPVGRVYRAALRAADPLLIAGQEDAIAGSSEAWQPIRLAPEAVPPWLQVAPLVTPPGFDLLQQPPMDLPERTAALREYHGLSLAVGWTGNETYWAADSDALIVGPDNQRLELHACPLCLGLGLPRDGVRHLVLGCHDQGLRGIRLGTAQLPEAVWIQPVEGLPTAVAVACTPAGGWPDVLAATRDGMLSRLRYVGRDVLKRRWEDSLTALAADRGFTTLRSWLDLAKTMLGSGIEELQARALAQILIDRATTTPTAAQAELDALGCFLLQPEFAPHWTRLAGELSQLASRTEPIVPAARQLVGVLAREGLYELRQELMRGLPDKVRMEIDPAGQQLNIAPVQIARLENQAEEPEKADPDVWLSTLREAYVPLDRRFEHQLRPRAVAWLTGPTRASSLAVMGRSQLQLRSLHPDGRMGAVVTNVTLGDQQSPTVLRTLRSIDLGGGTRVAMIGGQGGRAALVAANGLTADLGGIPGAACRAGVGLGPGSDGFARLALIWVEGHRSFLELHEVRLLATGFEIRRVIAGYLPLPVSQANDIDADLITNQLAIADASTHEAVLLQFNPSLTALTELYRFPLDSAPACLRMGGDLLVVGTRGGLLWGFDIQSADLRWTYRAGQAIRSLDRATINGQSRFLVAADPEDLVLIDDRGKRLWRAHFGQLLRSASFLEKTGNQIGLAAVRGLVELLLASDRSQLLSDECVSDRKAVFWVLKERLAILQASSTADRVDLINMLFDPKARRWLAEDLARDSSLSHEQRRKMLQEATHRIVGAVATALPFSPPAGSSMLLWEAVVRPWKDDEAGECSQRAQRAAVAEILRRPDLDPPALTELEQRLALLDDDVLEDAWVAVEAARAWLRRLPQVAPPERGEALVRELHRVRLPMLRGFRLNLLPASLAQTVAGFEHALRQVQEGQVVDAGLAQQLAQDLAQAAPPHGLAHGLALALRFLTHLNPRWEDLLGLIAAGRTLPATCTGPLADLVRVPARKAPSDRPEDSWLLSRQLRWLHETLAQPAELPSSREAWFALANHWAVLLEQQCESVLRARLALVERTCRPFLRIERILRPRADRCELHLLLEPEGREALQGLQVEVAIVPQPGVRPLVDPPQHRFAREVFGPGEPPERFQLSLHCEPDLADIRIEVSSTSRNRSEQTIRWPVPLPSVKSEQQETLLAQVPELVEQMLTRLRSMNASVRVLALDPLLGPEALRQPLLADGETLIVPLDALLADVGPGRTYPELLNLPRLQIAIQGQHPLAKERGLPSLPLQPKRRTLLWPCHQTVERLAAPELQQVRAELRAWLGEHQKNQRSPALIWLLPSEQAARVARWLGQPSGIQELVRCTPTTPEGWQDLGRWLARTEGKLIDEAEPVLRQECCGDLRVLASRLARPQTASPSRATCAADILPWTRADLGRLDPVDQLLLVSLIGSIWEVTAGRLEPLQQNPSFPHQLRKFLTPQPAHMARFVDLVFLQLKDRRCSSLPLYARGLAHALEQEHSLAGAFAWLTSGSSLLDGIELPQLRQADRELLQLALLPEPPLPILQQLGRIWASGSQIPKETDIRPATVKLTGLAVEVIREGVGREVRQAIDDSIWLVGLGPANSQDCYAHYLAWVHSSIPQPNYPALIRSLSSLATRQTGGPPTNPLLILIGPGVETWQQPARSMDLVLVRERTLRRILRAERWEAAFWGAVRAKAGLAKLSPYNTVGALPPGSTMFVGRQAILDEILEHLHERNFLVLGTRQIGKTSLLNQVRARAAQRAHLGLVYIDCQGMTQASDLVSELHRAARALEIKLPDLPPIELLTELVDAQRQQERVPVFLLNEIDGFAESDPALLTGLRRISEGRGARFVMVAYATTGRYLNDPTSPLFHMTAVSTGEKAFNLGALSREEALQLIDRLEQEPLGLIWDPPGDRARGQELILNRSYRIPWVVQRICAQLVQLLDRQQRVHLTVDDLRAVAERTQPVLDHLLGLEWDRLAGRPGRLAAKHAGLALLLAVVRQRYFRADRQLVPEIVVHSDPTLLAFTATEAQALLLGEAAELYNKREKERVLPYLRSFPSETLLDSLCLTLVLAPVVGQPHTYCFQHHIFPLELRRAASSGRSVADRLVDCLIDLQTALTSEQGGT